MSVPERLERAAPAAAVQAPRGEADVDDAPPAARTLRVCLVTNVFYPLYGGATLRFKRYIPRLRERGVDVHVVSGTPKRHWSRFDELDGGWREHREGALLPPETIDGISVRRVRLPGDRSPVDGWRFGRVVYEHCLAERPDVVHCTSVPTSALPWFRRLRRHGIPTLQTQTLVPRQKRSRLRRALSDRMVRLSFDSFDRAVVGSEGMRELLRQTGVRRPIEVVGHGVDLERFHPPVAPEERMAVRRTLGLGPSDPMVLAVGAIHPRKGSHLLIEAWHRILRERPDAHLVMVGPRQDRTQPSLGDFGVRIEALLGSAPVPGRIHLTGLVENVEAYLRAADVLVLASRREGVPNAVLEAMASGLPVVLTPFPGLPAEFGAPGREYLLCDRDSAALASELARLLAEPELRKRLGRTARAWVESECSVDRSVDAYARIYRELAGRSPTHGADGRSAGAAVRQASRT